MSYLQLKEQLNYAVIKHVTKPHSRPKRRVVLDKDKFDVIISELDFLTADIKQKLEGMRFRGLYFTTGGVDEITKFVLWKWKWGWERSQTNVCLFLGFFYLSWTF